jgi:uncharacterized membrane protein
MHNYIAVVFSGTGKVYEGLHALWALDSEGDITVYGASVVHRNEWGEFQVDTKETQPAMATAVGVGIGALLGALAGPAGAAVGAAGGAAIGAAAGGAVGLGTDLAREDTRQQATHETALILDAGQSAVIADVSEDSTIPIDSRMRELGGIVHRRAWSMLQNEAWFGEYVPSSYLYPYEYIPPAHRL